MTAPMSLRRYLLLGILLPVIGLIVLNTISLYSEALAAVNTAYDRTLLASAKVIGEQLDVEGYDELSRLRATVPYSALEAFEADNRSRIFYRVSSLGGEMVSGFAELPFWRGTLPQRPPYAALVDFYDDRMHDEPCAWPSCCSRWSARRDAAWPWCRWPRRWNCAAPWPGRS